MAEKLRAAIGSDLKPILCVGEQEKTRKSGKTIQVVKKQLKAAVGVISSEDMEHVVIAYEPVWAIGTGLTATPVQAEEVHSMIRDTIFDLHGENIADAIKILYGGSVTPENALSLMEQDNIDGALVGGASLKPLSFLRIVFYDNQALVENKR